MIERNCMRHDQIHIFIMMEFTHVVQCEPWNRQDLTWGGSLVTGLVEILFYYSCNMLTPRRSIPKKTLYSKDPIGHKQNFGPEEFTLGVHLEGVEYWNGAKVTLLPRQLSLVSTQQNPRLSLRNQSSTLGSVQVQLWIWKWGPLTP